jgi:hypothetical protein
MNTTAPQLYKLTTTPSGRKLWTYMAAILEVTGMDQGQTFPLKKFLGNFKTHLDNGRISRVDDGYQLTPRGRDYFRDRYNPGNPQHIDRAEVKAMIRGITTGAGSDEWIAVE